ncbi:MAG TPA: hypothetical protein PLZ93_21275, partial [Nocardioides sp.]|nr:hypothetical protein [Nocardioides sp.]
MSLTVVAPEHVESSPARAGVPAVPPWALSRWRLHHQLDLGTASALTVVTAPTGAGKSLGVASWAAGTSSTPALVWLDLRHGGTESDRVWP